MNLLILDTEPKWLALWVARGVPTVTTLSATLEAIQAGQVNTVIVSACNLEMVPPLVQAGVMVVVASGLLSASEAIAAYRAGAMGYVVKDFREGR